MKTLPLNEEPMAVKIISPGRAFWPMALADFASVRPAKKAVLTFFRHFPQKAAPPKKIGGEQDRFPKVPVPERELNL
jgi:hypothetical protein